MTHMTGGCLCEKIRYRISSAPISQGICYCRQCQKAGGASGSPLMVLQKEAFECTRTTLASYRTTSNRGSTVTRFFCRECGSPIFSQISDVPGIVTVKAATLDEPHNFKPEYLVWTQSAGPAGAFPPDVPSFPENAPIHLLLKP